jgi:hypothetical protein
MIRACTMVQLGAAALAGVAVPATSQADGLRIPFMGSLQGGGRVITADHPTTGSAGGQRSCAAA